MESARARATNPRARPKFRQESTDFSSHSPLGSRRNHRRAPDHAFDMPPRNARKAKMLMATIISITRAVTVRRPDCWKRRKLTGTRIAAKSSIAHNPMSRSTKTVTMASVFLCCVSRAAYHAFIKSPPAVPRRNELKKWATSEISVARPNERSMPCTCSAIRQRMTPRIRVDPMRTRERVKQPGPTLFSVAHRAGGPYSHP
jgi:hypothetical protein